MSNVLNECIAFASSGYRIFNMMKFDEFQMSKGFESLLDIVFREFALDRTNIKSGENQY